MYYLFLSKHRPYSQDRIFDPIITSLSNSATARPSILVSLSMAPQGSWRFCLYTLYSRSSMFEFSVQLKGKRKEQFRKHLKIFIFPLQRAYRGHPPFKRLANSTWKGLWCELISLQLKFSSNVHLLFNLRLTFRCPPNFHIQIDEGPGILNWVKMR